MRTIQLSQGKETIVDDDVFELLNDMKWHVMHVSDNKMFYAARSISLFNGARRKSLMHHYIIGKPLKGFMIDHRNGDSLDNRRENLRIVTNRVNQQNRKAHRNGRLVGASYHRASGKWRSYIRMDGVVKSLGYFDTERQAHNKYMREAMNAPPCPQ